MRKPFVALVLALPLALTACGGGGSEYLAEYHNQVENLPGGPYEPVSDERAVELGEKACSDLGVITRGQALLTYASEHTELEVANYNAAMNAAEATALCE